MDIIFQRKILFRDIYDAIFIHVCVEFGFCNTQFYFEKKTLKENSCYSGSLFDVTEELMDS